ncbi:hypothetical protein GGI24_004679, partial [Coemansia furcata]
GQTVVHEDEDEEIASLPSQLPVTGPPSGHVPVLTSAAASNADQGISSADNGATQVNDAADSAESAVAAAAAAVEDVAAATYHSHAIGNIAAVELDSPVTGREDMSVDGENSVPATPSDPTNGLLPELLLPAESGAVNTTNNNEDG